MKGRNSWMEMSDHGMPKSRKLMFMNFEIARYLIHRLNWMVIGAYKLANFLVTVEIRSTDSNCSSTFWWFLVENDVSIEHSSWLIKQCLEDILRGNFMYRTPWRWQVWICAVIQDRYNVGQKCVSAHLKAELTQCTDPLIEYTLIICIIQCVFIAWLLAAERTTVAALRPMTLPILQCSVPH